MFSVIGKYAHFVCRGKQHHGNNVTKDNEGKNIEVNRFKSFYNCITFLHLGRFVVDFFPKEQYIFAKIMHRSMALYNKTVMYTINLNDFQ